MCRTFTAAGDVVGFPARGFHFYRASFSRSGARLRTGRQNQTASTLPYCIWTIPEVAMFGMTEEECLHQGRDYEVGRAFYRNNARGQIMAIPAAKSNSFFHPAITRFWAYTSSAKTLRNWCMSVW
jgi:NAD(P) transhydrogenase